MHSPVHDILSALEEQGIVIPPQFRENLRHRIQDVLSYRPRVGLLGKTGAGKSTLCNTLFGEDVSPVSTITAGTRSATEVALQGDTKGLILVDVPGVGESKSRDAEYGTLYAEVLPKLDLVLWLIKVDDRALRVDEEVYHHLVQPHMDQGKPLLIVLTQVEKMEPSREWDYTTHQPSATVLAHIRDKQLQVAQFFDLPLHQVLAVSAHEHYGLMELIDTVVHAMPKERKLTMVRETKAEYVSESSREEASFSFVDVALGFLKDFIPAELIFTTVVSLGKRLLSIFF